MNKMSTLQGVIAISALLAFGFSFFILYWHTQALLSSLVAASFSAVLIGGSVLVLSWFVRAKL